MPPVQVATAARAEMHQCVALIALAFSSDPAARWLYKDAGAFLENFPRFIRSFGCAAFDCETAHYIDGCAAALWIPPGEHPDEAELIALIEGTVAPGERDALFAIFEQMGAARPEEPHWYLPLIGTDPTKQGQGYGSALLDHALSICDAQKVPAYLEATSPRSAKLYRRHGFEDIGTIQVGTSPTITPMVRKPR